MSDTPEYAAAPAATAAPTVESGRDLYRQRHPRRYPAAPTPTAAPTEPAPTAGPAVDAEGFRTTDPVPPIPPREAAALANTAVDAQQLTRAAENSRRGLESGARLYQQRHPRRAAAKPSTTRRL